MFQRHDLAYLSATGWQQAGGQLGETDQAALHQWQKADWPAIVRRDEQKGQGEREQSTVKEISLGIALPPLPGDGSKRRIGFSVATTHISRLQRPLSLDEAIGHAPSRWRQELLALDAEAKKMDVILQVYGSLAMQSLTGLHYLTASSDIDILFSPASLAQLEKSLRLLADFNHDLPLDGEVIFPDMQAVAWKELSGYLASGGFGAMGKMRVLSKSLHGVSLQPISSLLASFGGA